MRIVPLWFLLDKSCDMTTLMCVVIIVVFIRAKDILIWMKSSFILVLTLICIFKIMLHPWIRLNKFFVSRLPIVNLIISVIIVVPIIDGRAFIVLLKVRASARKQDWAKIINPLCPLQIIASFGNLRNRIVYERSMRLIVFSRWWPVLIAFAYFNLNLEVFFLSL